MLKEYQVCPVGGAVRDELLGLPVVECDWVVVGSTPEAMREAGFRQTDPDFPVFLHPRTGEEYALARRETKVGEGYRGFVVDAGPDVSLEEDLARRDLTINAMARDAEGRLIDPFGGERDLADGLLRHVTPAFVEDPVRLLRVARFAARFAPFGLRVAHGTHQMMKRMVAEGLMRELRPQRIWQELYKALSYAQPWRFFEVLAACGGLSDLLPELATQMRSGHGDTAAAPAIEALKRSVVLGGDSDERLLVLLLVSGESPDVAAQRLGMPPRLWQRLQQARAFWPRVCELEGLHGGAVADLLDEMGAWRRDDRFEVLLRVFRAQPDAPVRLNDLARVRERALTVDPRALQVRGFVGAALGEALARARREAIESAW